MLSYPPWPNAGFATARLVTSSREGSLLRANVTSRASTLSRCATPSSNAKTVTRTADTAMHASLMAPRRLCAPRDRSSKGNVDSHAKINAPIPIRKLAIYIERT